MADDTGDETRRDFLYRFRRGAPVVAAVAVVGPNAVFAQSASRPSTSDAPSRFRVESGTHEKLIPALDAMLPELDLLIFQDWHHDDPTIRDPLIDPAVVQALRNKKTRWLGIEFPEVTQDIVNNLWKSRGLDHDILVFTGQFIELQKQAVAAAIEKKMIPGNAISQVDLFDITKIRRFASIILEAAAKGIEVECLDPQPWPEILEAVHAERFAISLPNDSSLKPAAIMKGRNLFFQRLQKYDPIVAGKAKRAHEKYKKVDGVCALFYGALHSVIKIAPENKAMVGVANIDDEARILGLRVGTIAFWNWGKAENVKTAIDAASEGIPENLRKLVSLDTPDAVYSPGEKALIQHNTSAYPSFTGGGIFKPFQFKWPWDVKP